MQTISIVQKNTVFDLATLMAHITSMFNVKTFAVSKNCNTKHEEAFAYEFKVLKGKISNALGMIKYVSSVKSAFQGFKKQWSF